MKHKFKKRNKIIITICFLILFLLSCAVFDILNLPSKLGFNTSIINLDFWSILLGNGIVISLFIITFTLFDKKNLEKEKLADYAGAVLLLDTYRQIESFLTILHGLFDIPTEKQTPFSAKQIEFIDEGPFKNNDKIFDFLSEGHILRDHYEGYVSIKQNYEALVFCMLREGNFENIQKKLLEILNEQIANEKAKLEKHRSEIK